MPNGVRLPHWAAARWEIDLGVMRWLGVTMLVLGATLPHIAHNPGLPCPLRTVTGVPCPLCGMTTSVKGVCTGHLREAVAANPFGLLAVGVAIVLLVRPRLRSVTLPLMAILAMAATSWIWELHRFHWV